MAIEFDLFLWPCDDVAAGPYARRQYYAKPVNVFFEPKRHWVVCSPYQVLCFIRPERVETGEKLRAYYYACRGPAGEILETP